MIEIKPTKTFRGTWEEILSHQSEIPAGSTVQVTVFEPATNGIELQNGAGDFGGKSVYEMFKDVIGTVSCGPPDLAENAEEYLAKSDFGVTRDIREIKP